MAEVYDQTYRAKFEPSVLGPVVELPACLAGGGPALEFAVGTRAGCACAQRPRATVHGLELSPYMAAQLHAGPGADAVPVAIGDMRAARVPGRPSRWSTWWRTRS